MQTIEPNQRREISPQWTLPVVRLVQFGLILLLAEVGFSLEGNLIIRLLAIITASAICVIVGHPFASMAGDGEGLYVQRYLKVHFVRWADITEVRTSLNDGGIRVDFRHSVGQLRYAVTNFPNMTVKEAAAVATARKEPEIVTWMLEQVRGAQQSQPSTTVLGL